MTSLLLLLRSAGCTPAENEGQAIPKPLPSTSSAPTSPHPASPIDAVLAVPAGFKPVYKVVKIDDVSSAIASRKAVAVSLPDGLNRSTLDLNLKQAAKEVYEKEKPDAIIVHAYRHGESTDAAYTVGMLTFAPFGDWARADEKSSIDNYKAVIEVRNDYLQPRQPKGKKKH